MVVLKRGVLAVLGIAGGVAVLSLGIAGYALLAGSGDRIDAERFLFWSLTGFLVFSGGYLAMILRARSLDRRLDRLISQGFRRDLVPGRDFQNLGAIGERLTTIFNQMSRQNYMKSRKISAMHDLAEFLVRNSEKTIIACDATGVVRYASDGADELLGKDRTEFMGEAVQALFPDLPFGRLRSGLLQERLPRTSEDGPYEFTCYPIEDRSGELAYLVFLFNAKARFFSSREKTPQADAARKGIFSAGMARLRRSARK